MVCFWGLPRDHEGVLCLCLAHPSSLLKDWGGSLPAIWKGVTEPSHLGAIGSNNGDTLAGGGAMQQCHTCLRAWAPGTALPLQGSEGRTRAVQVAPAQAASAGVQDAGQGGAEALSSFPLPPPSEQLPDAGT